MNIQISRLTLSLCLGVSLLVGCVEEVTSPHAVSFSALTPCDQNWNGSFPTDTDRVVVRVPGGTIGGSESATFTEAELWGNKAQLVVSGIVPGDDISVEVFGCSGPNVTWAGMTPGVAVEAHHKTSVPIFLSAVGEFSCSYADGGADLAYEHASTATYDDGRDVWLMGGFRDYQLTQGQKPPGKLYATQDVHRYVRSTRTFENGGSLDVARGGGIAQPLSDGRVRLLGGVKTLFLQLQKDVMPMFWPSEDVAHATEIFNPASGKGTANTLLTLPVMPSTLMLRDGSAIAVGGATFAGAGPLVFSPTEAFSDSFTVFGMEPEDVEQGTLHHPRFGASVVDLDEGHVLVWGGSAVVGAGGLGEVLVLETMSSVALDVAGVTVMPQFAAAAAIAPTAAGGYRVLVVGGANVVNDGATPQFGAAAAPRFQLVSIGLDDQWANVEDIQVPALGDFTRAGASLLSRDSATDELWWFGGLKNFQDNPGDPGLPPRMLRFSVSGQTEVAFTDLGPTLELSPDFGTFGASAVDLHDGSWLMVGGLRSVGGQSDPVSRGSWILRYDADDSVCQGD